MNNNDETKGQGPEDDAFSPSPLNLVDLRMRIAACDSSDFSELSDIISELMAYGPDAYPVMPSLVEKYRTDELNIGTTLLVNLFLATRFLPLIAAVLEKGGLKDCNMSQKGALLEAGFDIEQQILDDLNRPHGRPSGPKLWQTPCVERHEAVKSLGVAGGAAALECLEVVRYRLEGQVAEIKAKRLLGQHEDNDVSVEEIRSSIDDAVHEDFLDHVRDAIKQIKARATT